MKKLLPILFLFIQIQLFSQEDPRLKNIQNQIQLLSVENTGLTETLKLETKVNNVTLSNFLVAVSKIHKVNLNVSPDLAQINIVNNFSNVTVGDLLVFLCKEYQLDIDFSGNILSIKRYVPSQSIPEERKIPVSFDSGSNEISLDLKGDPLQKAFRAIIDASGKNLFFSEGMETVPLTFYIRNVDFDKAMENLAATNGMAFSKSRDGFYYFSLLNPVTGAQNGNRGRAFNSNDYFYEIVDQEHKLLNVDFKNAPVSRIINDIGLDLGIDVYTAAPMDNAGFVTFKASGISFDRLLDKIFENAPSEGGAASGPNTIQNGVPQNNAQSYQAKAGFTYKKEGDIYFFGTANLLSVRKVEHVRLKYRSVEILGDPSTQMGSARRNTFNPGNYQNFSDYNYSSQGNNFNNQNNRNNFNNQSSGFNANASTPKETSTSSLLEIVPEEIKSGLEIQSDKELNSFIVMGSGTDVERFKRFLEDIDKPVPVVLIEVMFLEVNKDATIETGLSWGIGKEPVKTQGGIFPDADITLGANTVNKIIGGFDGFGSFNIGKVVPEFFVSIKAMEQSGDVKILSTPKISTLNGHRAIFSNSETSYYAVTTQNFLGSQNPITSEITNYYPIDAGLMLSIKPYVSGDGQITLDIFVTQSAFNGDRIAEDAPPGINAREFSSIIRMRDQDIAVLGGLEQNYKNNSGTGVPLLSRVPVLKWLFSKRKKESSRKKLTVLIKPTIIN